MQHPSEIPVPQNEEPSRIGTSLPPPHPPSYRGTESILSMETPPRNAAKVSAARTEQHWSSVSKGIVDRRSPSSRAPLARHRTTSVSPPIPSGSRLPPPNRDDSNGAAEPRKRDEYDDPLSRPTRRKRSPPEREMDSEPTGKSASSSSSGSAAHSPSLPLPMSRLHSGMSSRASTAMPRLPSLSNLRRDLPDPKHSVTAHSNLSPDSAYSKAGSRGTPSSRGSSPRPGSSSASSASSRRRGGFGFTAAETVDNTVASTSDPSQYRYELVIRQQPRKAAAAGLSPAALSRLPIVPSPILQIRVTDQEGRVVPHRLVVQELPYLVCSCTVLRGADGNESPLDYAEVESTTTRPSRRRNPLAMLCGTRIYSAIEAVDIDGQMGLFFIFWDASIRQEGYHRLKFSLIEALPGSPTLATVISEPFETVSFAEFPGEVAISTELSRHFAREGLNVYLPPLGVSTGV